MCCTLIEGKLMIEVIARLVSASWFHVFGVGDGVEIHEVRLYDLRPLQDPSIEPADEGVITVDGVVVLDFDGQLYQLEIEHQTPESARDLEEDLLTSQAAAGEFNADGAMLRLKVRDKTYEIAHSELVTSMPTTQSDS